MSTGSRPISPFVLGGAVLANCFYGRDPELKQIISSSDWIWLCGQRRIGRTSVLLRVRDLVMEAGGTALFIDLSGLGRGQIDSQSFFYEFVRECSSRGLQSQSVSLETLRQMPPEQAFQVLIELLIEQSRSKTVVMLWDEAEKLFEFDPGFLMRFRARVSGIPGFKLIINGSQRVCRLFESAPDFLHQFQWFPLAGLDQQSCVRLLQREQTGGWHSRIPSELCDQAVQWSGGHPFVLQSLGAELSRATGDHGRKITGDILAEAQAKIFVSPLLQHTLRDDLQLLSERQNEVLGRVASHLEGAPRQELDSHYPGKTAELEDALAFLQAYGYVSCGRTIRLNYAWYRKWLSLGQTESRPPAQLLGQIRRTIFISYSHLDNDLCEQFEQALRPRLRDHPFDLWSDRKINAGDEWRQAIRTAIARAQVAVLLLSNDFLNSKFIVDEEVPTILVRAKTAGCRIICVHARASSYETVVWTLDNHAVRLDAYQAANDPKHPLDSFTRARREKQLKEISAKIEAEVLGLTRDSH